MKISKSTKSPKSPQPLRSIDKIVHDYGDLLYDLCATLVENTVSANQIFGNIVRELRAGFEVHSLRQYERLWVLKIASRHLMRSMETQDQNQNDPTQPDPFVQNELDSNSTGALAHLKYYFKKLFPDERLLFLFRDKYHFPYFEIAGALEIPEESLKTKRQQALRKLEDWIWAQS